MRDTVASALMNLVATLTRIHTRREAYRPADVAKLDAMRSLFLIMGEQRQLLPPKATDFFRGTANRESAPFHALFPETCRPTEPEEQAAIDELRGLAEGEIWPTEWFELLAGDAANAVPFGGREEARVRIQRRHHGAYYTHRRLVQAVVSATLRPFLSGPALGSNVPGLRILDPAVGGAAFLVEALNELTQSAEDSAGGGQDARRHIVEHCLFGVDIDPIAVSATRARLWLEAGGCDVNLLSQHVVLGDTLLGVTPGASRQFDAVIGNPPWNKIKADLKEFYSHYDSAVLGMQGDELKHYVQEQFRKRAEIKELWDQHQIGTKQYSRALALSPMYVCQSRKVNGRLAPSDPDLYKFFLERSIQLTRDGGRVGMILPASLGTAEGAAQLRALLLKETCITSYVSIENHDRIFPIDSRFKYAILVAEKGAGPTHVLPSRFMMRSVEEAATALSGGDLLRVPMRGLEDEWNSFLDFRTPQDLSLFEKLQHSYPSLGDKLEGTWNVRFVRELDMTNDSRYFRSRESFSPKEPREDFVPLYEGRMIHQFDHAFKGYERGHGRKAEWRELPWSEKSISPHYLVDRTVARSVQGFGRQRVGYCDVSGQTNERTVLAALIPGDSVAGNKVPTLRLTGLTEGRELKAQLLWLAIANSFVVDWLMRLRMSTTINFFHWQHIPFPRLDPEDKQARRLIDLASSLSTGESRPNSLRRLQATVRVAGTRTAGSTEWERQFARAEIDALVALLYGLNAAEYAYILSTFPLLDRRQPPLPGDYGPDGRPRSFITRDLALLAFLELQGMQAPDDLAEFYYRAGVDVRESTGTIRNLRLRVGTALSAGALAYVPTGVRGFAGADEAAD